MVSVCACPRARGSLARSRGFGWRSTSRRSTPVAGQAPSRSNGVPGNCSIDDDLGVSIGYRLGQVVQLLWGPTRWAAPGWFHNLLVPARDREELCPLLCCPSDECPYQRPRAIDRALMSTDGTA